jgi:hypothetical protein
MLYVKPRKPFAHIERSCKNSAPLARLDSILHLNQPQGTTPIYNYTPAFTL